MNFRFAAPLRAVLLALAASPAAAVDVSVSGFGTIGYARSNQPYTYQRFIDNGGTFKRDSLLGLQLDAKLTERVGATVQVKAAPSVSNDNRYAATISWAFLSYRPTNDWLLRAGKLRIPFYLYSENNDVGATFDFARLPNETYAMTPTTDFTGLSLSRSWGLHLGELTLDGFWGKAKTDIRFWVRDNFPPRFSAGPLFWGFNFEGEGLALTLKRDEDTYRVGLGQGVIKPRDGVPVPQSFPFVTLLPGIGYYQIDPSQPGPGLPTTTRINFTDIRLGAEVNLPAGMRVISEYVRRIVRNTDIGPDTTAAYASLLKRIGKWTPYITYAFLRSEPGPRNLYTSVNYNTVPAFIPLAARINASQRAAADMIVAFDQSSWALGTSYSLSPTSKIKAEYMRVHIGQMSSLVDAPPGGDVRNQDINVLSLSYNFVF